MKSILFILVFFISVSSLGFKGKNPQGDMCEFRVLNLNELEKIKIIYSQRGFSDGFTGEGDLSKSRPIITGYDWYTSGVYIKALIEKNSEGNIQSLIIEKGTKESLSKTLARFYFYLGHKKTVFECHSIL